MNQSTAFHSLLDAALAELDDPARTTVVNAGAGAPRFELFHAGLSICSQKARVVLAEHATPYVSHEMVIVASKGLYSDDFRPAENYRPGFVRLRLLGGAELGGNYASSHTGSSSVATEGFDPCVVPLLVDREQRRVIVDSMRICAHLDASAGPPLLLPPNDAQVRRQVDIVDRLPHPAILYGFHPDDDQRPDFIQGVMRDVHDLKCESLQKFIDDNRDDETLVAAYRSKIAKEQAGKALAFDPERQRRIRATIQDLIEDLDQQLGASADPWLCGATFSMADVVWAISLYRMQWLGLADLWADKPRIKDYAALVYQRPSIRSQVIDYPSPMPPSPHTRGV